MGKAGKTLGRKYMQDNLFKPKEKEHHEIVISDEVVRSSKLFRMLKEKMIMRDAIFVKECNELAEVSASPLRKSKNSKQASLPLKHTILRASRIYGTSKIRSWN